MSDQVRVEFLEPVGEDRRGEVKTIDARRAQRLARTGYARILDDVEPATTGAQGKTSRGARPERRG